MNVLSAALALAEQGLSVFPCRLDKRPATRNGFKDASRDPAALFDLWRRSPGELIGIATGTVSELAVLDIDAKKGGGDWWAERRDRLPVTRTIRTRSGGLHLHFRHLPGLRCSASVIAPGIDVRADGGYAIAWHCAGQSVLHPADPAPWPTWLLSELQPPCQPLIAVPARMPERTADHASAYALGALRRAIQRVAAAPEGQRNDLLNAETFSLARFVAEDALSPCELAEAMAHAAFAAGLPPLEVQRTIASALRAGVAT